MATNRVPIRRLSKGRITPEAINAWKRCDSDAPHLALGLAPWEQSPLPEEVTSLGVSEDNPPDPKNIGAWDSSYDKAIKLQRKLVATVGWPDCRAAYEANLKEAKEWAAYCAKLVKHPELGGQGTGCDPVSRRAALKEAQKRVAYRKKLLADLDHEAEAE
jgi:hypothetical protein